MRWSVLSIVGLAACLVFAPAALAANQHLMVNQSISFGDYELTRNSQGQELSVPGLGSLLIPGMPRLPSRIYAIAIPPGAEVVSVEFDVGEGISLPGIYDIAPAPLPRVIGDEDPVIAESERKRYQRNYDAVYHSDDCYPDSTVEFVRTAGYRKYNLVDVRITPFGYRPLSGQLTYYPDVSVQVHYAFPTRPVQAIVDNLPRTESFAQNLILNYGQAQQWYPQSKSTGRGLHDYVIVTLASLTSSVTDLVTWETSKGRNVEVVTTAWIAANYTGYDLAEQIRNFLRDKYPSGEWGIEDVLLVGHYDDVPMRRTEQDLGYGKPETDFYYAELSLSDADSWDDNVNRKWGEDSDAIDFYAEVNVGRIPWSGTTTVSNICQKSVAYEQNDDPAFKKNILLLGGFFWNDDPNPRTDNAVLMEAKVDQTWMSDWTMTRMYEQGNSTYPMDYNLTWTNVKNVWSAGTYAFVNWAGHGSPTSAHIYFGSGEAFVSTSTCPYLNDNYPAIIFADACSNSDTDYTNLGQSMLQQGGVGFVGATKVAYGCPGWDDVYDGSSQSLDYYFTTYVTSGDYTQGAALQVALTNMYTYGLWDNNRYETFEWGALWGNPNLGMGSAPALTITLPDGAPEALDPGVPTTFTVRIVDGTESYVPGSGWLHYRYDGITWHAALLTHDTGDLYLATLPPADCDDTPEFYISAAGDGGATVYSPSNAPGTVYEAVVGAYITIVDDNFETDQGWTTSDDGNATSGFWQRGVPVDDPSWNYAPASDSDGSGQCWLTENDNNPSYPDPWNTDVDGGAVTLTSYTIDMSGGNITISYDYYLNLTRPEDNNDVLLVEIDGNNGAGPWTQIARHNTNGGRNWRSHSIEQSDLDTAGVTLTSTMKLRFTANDADTQSINESGLDALLITGFSCSMPYGMGDLNCDGSVNSLDVDPFVLAMSSAPGFGDYYAAYPDCNAMLGDCNSDGSVNSLDIDPFVGLLAK